MAERPPDFEIKRPCEHPLAQGLVFAGLGRFPGTTRYHDSSLYGNTGTLTNFANPVASWGQANGRPSLAFDGVNDYANFTALGLMYGDALVISSWMYPGGECRFHIRDVAASNVITVRNRGVYLDVSPAASVVNYAAFIADWSGWHHAVIAINGGSCTGVWRDGSPLSAGGGDSPTLQDVTSNTFELGRGGYNNLCTAGTFSDFLIHKSIAPSKSIISALADPSNVMLAVGGNPLLQYRRKWWPVSAGAAEAGGFKPYWARRSSQTIGGGIA